MKKTLMTLSLISAIAIGTQASYAFDWGYLNPANWATCKKCEKVKPNCKCKKQKPCDPCLKPTPSGAAPCNPCEKVKPAPCDPCDRLQMQTER